MYRGKHLLIDCRDVSYDLCLEDQAVPRAMATSAERAGATVISQVRYHFVHTFPPGYTAMVLLDESHCSVFSHVDLGLIAMDVFPCDETNSYSDLRICPEPDHWSGLSGCIFSEGGSREKFISHQEKGTACRGFCRRQPGAAASS